MFFPGSSRKTLYAVLALTLAAGPLACARNPKGPARYEIAVGSEGYSPARVNAKAGEEVVLIFTRTTDQTCGTEVVFPSENRTVPLPLNKPVEVRLTPKEKGEISFTCGMKMFQGTVEVD